ncbi:MAG: MFS transporter [Dehalococcoidales bacterium]|nr:MFS transporter [Dehalococcoidales bacterium]
MNKRPAVIIENFYRNAIGRHKAGIWIVSLQSLLTAAGFSITIPFLSLYLFQDRGLTMTVVGIIMMAAGLFAALAHVLGGEISDRIGRRPVIIIALSIRTLMYAVMAILIGFTAPLWSIVTCYFIGQAIGMMERPASSAIVTDLSPRKKLTEAYGLLRVGMNLGWAAGPAIGGYMAMSVSYSWLFGVAALLTALAFIIVSFFLRETYTKPIEKLNLRSMSSVVKDSSFMVFSIISILFFLLMGQMMSTLSIYTVDIIGLSTAQYGLLLTTNGLIVVLLQYPVAYKLGSFSKSRLLIIGSLLHTIGFFIFGWSGAFAMSIAAMVIITLGEIIHAPTSLAVVGEIAPPKYRGRYMGVFGLTQVIGVSTAPLLGGILLDIFPSEPLIIWGSLASLGIAAAAGYYLWNKRYKTTKF